MQRTIYLLLILVFASFDVCKDQVLHPVAGCSACVTLSYQFINEGDTALTAVHLKSVTYRPDVDSTNIMTKTYTDSIVVPENPFYLTDTLQHSSYATVYGALAHFQATLSFHDRATRTVYRTCQYRSMVNYDTIQPGGNSVIVFHWPVDTATWVKIYDSK